MITFNFPVARVTAPNGDTYQGVVAQLRRGVLTFKADDEVHDIEVSDCWTHGQRGYGMTATDGGGVWYVKRTGASGCGGCG